VRWHAACTRSDACGYNNPAGRKTNKMNSARKCNGIGRSDAYRIIIATLESILTDWGFNRWQLKPAVAGPRPLRRDTAMHPWSAQCSIKPARACVGAARPNAIGRR
jgi:hypothetical protein